MPSSIHDHYRRNLAGEKVAFHDDKPECGRYRQERAGKWWPVAIYMQDGKMNAMVGRRPVAPESVWISCCRYPVTEEAYLQAFGDGTWPDDLPAGIGHNQPVDGDPYSAIKTEIHDATSAALGWLNGLKDGIKTKVDADKAYGTARELKSLHDKAEKLRAKEKQPHWDAGKAVDEKYKPLKTKADDTAKKLKKAVLPFKEEQDRKAEQIQRAATEAAEKAAAAIEAENPGTEAAPVDIKVETNTPKIGGQYRIDGKRRAASVAEIISAKVTDAEKCAMYFIKSPEMLELLKRLSTAKFRADNDAEIPGAEIKKEKEIR